MKILQRRMLGVLSLALSLLTAMTFSQTVAPTVAGSSLAVPILEAFAKDTNIATTSTGTAQAFQQFCNNQAIAVAASRPINSQEIATCASNNVPFEAYTLATQGLAFIANPQDAFNTCLTKSLLSQVFEPSANAVVTNWSILVNTNPSLDLQAYVPPSDTLIANQLDAFVEGVGFRRDAITLSEAEIIDAVANTSGAIGAVSYQAALARLGEIALVSVDFEDGQNGCVPASAETAELGAYPLFTTFALYVNSNERQVLQPVLERLSDPSNAGLINSLGFTAPTASQYLNNTRILANEAPAIAEEATFTVPSGLTGTVAIGGSPALLTLFNTTNGELTATQPNLTVTTRFEGEPSGLRRFCNGELDAVVVTQSLSAETLEACSANSVEPYIIPITSRAVVLVGNASDDFYTCLTVESIRNLWDARSTETVKNWNNVDESYPEQAITFFAISTGSELNDLLLAQANAPVAPLRSDANFDADPLYRAAATANVTGAITYMSWADYQRVLANNQQNVKLIAVQREGGKCVLPTQGSLQSGLYPLTKPTQLVVNQQRLADVNVQSYLWSFFSTSSNVNLLSDTAFADNVSATFADVRQELVKAFETAAIEAQAEATPDAEATPAS